MDAYLDGSITVALQARAQRRMATASSGLTPEEAAVVALLQRRLRPAIERDVARAA